MSAQADRGVVARHSGARATAAAVSGVTPVGEDREPLGEQPLGLAEEVTGPVEDARRAR